MLFTKNLPYIFLAVLVSLSVPVFGQQNSNKPDRHDWFHKLFYGLFIHWSADDQVGVAISHSLVGTSEEYKQKYYRELPQIFDPQKFDTELWARLAKVAGIKYVVFMTKHRSVFCMFNTKTTDFNIPNTPYKRGINRQIVNAFQTHGIAVGIYFSPDDFHYLFGHGILIDRRMKLDSLQNSPELMKYDIKQLQGLLTQYGKIDILFIDCPTGGIKQLTWKINPDLVITRGAMEAPEIDPSTWESLFKSILKSVWEGGFTVRVAWTYMPTNQHYQGETDLMHDLIDARAKNGGMLLDIGPITDYEIAQQQKDILREIGTWMFTNSDAIYGTEAWIISNKRNIEYMYSKNQGAAYAIVEKID